MDKNSDSEGDLSSSFHRLMSILDSAFRGLKRELPPLQIESLATLIHHAMSQRGRRYHAMPHIFEIIGNASPIEQLAIAFHDTIYVQVDRRIHPMLKGYLSDFPLQYKTRNLIVPDIQAVETQNLVSIAYEVFNISAGQTLTPNNGENEFLSAILAARVLDRYLNAWEIVQILACIEATIPFRPLNAVGLTPSDLMFQRLVKINKNYSLNRNPEELRNAVRTSVQVSNRDLKGFAYPDPGHFLSQTWELLLEGNPIFRNPLYTTFQYRSALQKVEGFFSFLKPEVIFRQFGDEPNTAQYKALLSQAQLNLSIGIDYIQTKLIGMAIHEAISSLSGGDGPLVLFRGDIPDDKNYKRSHLDVYLDHNIPVSAKASNNPVIYRLLKSGRTAPDGFDFLHSTLGAFLYERLEEKSLLRIIKKSKEFFAGTTPALEFLTILPKPILLAVLKATAQVAWSRKAPIADLIKKFSS